LVGIGVTDGGLGGLVGKVIGLPVGFAVGDSDGPLAPGIVGVTLDCFVGYGESADGIGLLKVGGSVFTVDGSAKLGVMDGTGVNSWYAMAVDRYAISSAPGF
jgi:hypothetical protein